MTRSHTMMLPLAAFCFGLAAISYSVGGTVGLVCAALNLVLAGIQIGGWYQTR